MRASQQSRKVTLTESKRPGSGQTAISRIPLPDKGAVDWFDAGSPGLTLRIGHGGRRTWTHLYRLDGRLKRRTLGIYPAMSLDEARATWATDRSMLHDGIDPKGAHEKRVAEAAAERASEQTFAEAIDAFHKHYLRGEAGVAGADRVRSMLLRECVAWDERPVRSILGTEIGALLRSVRDERHGRFDGRPYLSNRLHAHLGTFFKWCARPDVGLVPGSPMAGVPRPFSGEEERQVAYTAEQIGALWRAAGRMGAYEGAFLRLMLLTGKRKSALTEMRRADNSKDGWWYPPQSKKRQRRETKHNWPIPIPDAGLDVLFRRPYRIGDRIERGLPQIGDCPFMFEGRHHGKPIAPGRSFQDKVRAATGIEAFMFHGIRHTVITQMAWLRLPTDLIDRFTDHSPRRGTGRDYDHHEARDQLHDLADTWGRYVRLVARPLVWSRIRAHLEASDLLEGDGKRAAQRERMREFCGLVQAGGKPWSHWVRDIARQHQGGERSFGAPDKSKEPAQDD